MKTPLRVLIVEDSESDAITCYNTSWKKRNIQFTTNELKLQKTWKRHWKSNVGYLWLQIINLPQFSAPAALALLQKTKLDIPFIVVSGYVGDEDAVNSMKSWRAGLSDEGQTCTPCAGVWSVNLPKHKCGGKIQKNEEESLLLVQTVKSVRDCISLLIWK